MRFLAMVFMLCLPAFVQAGEIYKWRDKYGNIHYSDKEPVDQQAQRKQIKASEPKPVAPAEQKPTTTCDRLRNNVDTLTKSTVVQMDLNNDGVAEVLSAEQRDQQLKAMQTAYAANCSK